MCRSAGAHILSETLIHSINEYTCGKVHVDSFAMKYANPGKKATPYLLKALDKGREQFTAKIAEKINRDLEPEEKEAFSRLLQVNKDKFRASWLTSSDRIAKKNTIIYVPSDGLIVDLQALDTYQEIPVKPKIERMDPNTEIADGAWMTTQLLATSTFRQLLAAYPGSFEKRDGPFTDELVDRARLGKYDVSENYRPFKDTDSSSLKAGDVGFIYHNLVTLKDMTDRYGHDFGYNDGGFKIGNTNTYDKSIFPTPYFIRNSEEMLAFLDSDDNPKAKEIAAHFRQLEQEHIVPAYIELCLKLLDVALARLPTCSAEEQ